MRSASLALVALLLLAGCSGGSGKDPGGDGPDFSGFGPPTATTGIVRGVVVDEAIRPIAQATVTLLTTPPRSMQTRDDGAFGFDQIPPGSYFLSARKGGYVEAQGSAEVVAGEAEPPAVKVQLLPDASFVQPYAETYVFDGFMECSAGGAIDTGNYGVANVCSTEVPGYGKAFTNDNTQAEYQISGAPDWVQAEMVWTSTQAASHAMSLSFAIETDDLTTHQDGWDDLTVVGPSPLLNTMDAETTQAYLDNGTMVLRIFPWADQEPGVIVAVEQRFTVYTTVFHGYTPPAGWLFSVDGTVPAPPA